jgi:hypothetical protein
MSSSYSYSFGGTGPIPPKHLKYLQKKYLQKYESLNISSDFISASHSIEFCRPIPNDHFNCITSTPGVTDCGIYTKDLKDFPLDNLPSGGPCVSDMRISSSEMTYIQITLNNYHGGGTVTQTWKNRDTGQILASFTYTVNSPNPEWTWWYWYGWSYIGHFSWEILLPGNYQCTIDTSWGNAIIDFVVVNTVGSVSLVSTPSVARIWIDGVDKGVYTPSTITGLVAGNHTYKLVLAGYADLTGNFTIVAGSSTPKFVTFLPSAYFTSTPSAARIWIDSADQLVSTPATITGLTAGPHTYLLVLAGYNDAEDNFSAIAGSTTTIPVTFLPETSKLITTSNTIQYSSDAEVTTTSFFYYALMKSITVTHGYIGSWRIIFDLRGDWDQYDNQRDNPATNYAQIYINGSPYGTVRENGDINYATFVEDFSDIGIPNGAVVQLYGLFDLSGYYYQNCAVRNFRIEFDNVTGGSASFISSPQGARIWIDEVDKLLDTPYIVPNISSGNHNYTLKLTGYDDANGSFAITASTITYIPSVTLIMAFGNVSFISTPTGAVIWIDEVNIGQVTPYTKIGLIAGSHTYRLVKTCYANATGTFQIDSGLTTPISITLQQGSSITASNTIQYSSDAEIWTYSTSPYKLKEITVANSYTGSWRIYFELVCFNDEYACDNFNTYGQIYKNDVPYGTLQNTGSYYYIGYNQDFTGINISNGDKIQLYAYDNSGLGNPASVRNFRIMFNQPDICGSVSFISTPTGATIWIDNVNIGQITPYTEIGLITGSHPYKLVKAGYADAIGTFQIDQGLTTTISETLQYGTSITASDTIHYSSDDINNVYGMHWNYSQNPIVKELTMATAYNGSWRISFALSGEDFEEGGNTYWRGRIYKNGEPYGTDRVVYAPPYYIGSVTYTEDFTGISTNTGDKIQLLGGVQSGDGNVHLSNFRIMYDEPPGSASFTSNPSSARIWIDGVDQLLNTPNTISNITVGNRAYTLKLIGYTDASGSFSVTSGSTTVVPEIILHTLANITIQNIMVGSTSCLSGCNITCVTTCPTTVNIVVTWSNSGGSSGTFIPTITITPPGTTTIPGEQTTVIPSGTGTTTFTGVNLPHGTPNVCIDTGTIT